MAANVHVRSHGLSVICALLLLLTLAGIIYHRVSGYRYPVSPAFSFEINVLGDIYEALFLVPVGLVGLWLLYTCGKPFPEPC